ncbi:MAG: HEAT repeat domain-containing protein [Acidobacteriota bacterium]|nr:HEAT repeat domain-containing protein [Blastocatellia bacterium]MDW8412482.1 HEAT repeat domain-containing protein [Acidobacteriota bacterium]
MAVGLALRINFLLCILALVQAQDFAELERRYQSEPQERFKLLPLLVERNAKRAQPLLLAATRDSDWVLRGRAAGLITNELRAELPRLATDSHWFVRGNAALALGNLACSLENLSEVYGLLSSLAEDEDAFVRQQVAKTTALLPDDELAFQLLDKLKSDRAPRVRWEVTFALASRKGQKALSLLAETPTDAAYWAAAYLLGKFEYLQPLVSSLASVPAPYDLRLKLAICLLGDPQSVELIASFAKEGDPRLQKAAVSALCKTVGRTATTALSKLLLELEDESLQLKIIEALAERNSEEALEGLLNALGRGNESIRQHLIEGLTRYKSAWAVEQLISSERRKSELLPVLAALDVTLDNLVRSIKGESSYWYDQQQALRWYGRLVEGSPVEVLLVALSHPDPRIRQEAVNIAAEHKGTQFVEMLLPLLDDEVEFVSDTTRSALEKLGIDRIHIERRLSSEDWRVRADAAELCGKMKYKDLDSALLIASFDEHPAVRTAALTALGKLESPEHLERIVQALRDSSQGVRFAAIMALGQMKHKRALVALTEILESDSTLAGLAAEQMLLLPTDSEVAKRLLELTKSNRWRVRAYAARILGEWRLVQAVPRMVELLQDKAAPVRYYARNALVSIGAPAVDLLVKALVSENSNKQAIAQALASIGKPAVASLCNLLQASTGQDKASAAIVLGEIGDITAAAYLIEALSDERFYVRDAVAASLAKLGREIIPQLEKAAKDKNPTRRAGVATVLKYLNCSDSLDILKMLSLDKDEKVRSAAAEALLRIGKPEAINKLRDIAEKDLSQQVRATKNH